MSKRLTEKIVVNDTEHRECVHTKATCHHKECKCSECPLTDLFCDEFYKAIDRCYEEAYASGCLAGIELGKTEYRDLEEQGLLLRLPCKLGDDLYWIASEDEDGNEKPTIRKFENGIKHITITENGIWVNAEDEAPTELDVLGGEYALLTYEEAEEKLRELEGK